MMSDTVLQSTARVRRPKRLLSKTSDDNVLGISWKEERELRRAIYVSLRDQHNTPSLGRAWVMSKLRARGSSQMVRMSNPRQAIPTGTYLLRHYHNSLCPEASVTTLGATNANAAVMVAADSTLRRAKLRATARLNGISSPPGRPSSPNWGVSSSNYDDCLSSKTNKQTKSVSTPRTARLQVKKSASARLLKTTASSHPAASSSVVDPGSPRKRTLCRAKKSLLTVNPDAKSARTRGSLRRSSVMVNFSHEVKADHRTLSSTPTPQSKRINVSTKKHNGTNKRKRTKGSHTMTGTARKRPNQTTSGQRKLNKSCSSGASVKNKLAKKLVSAAATKSKTKAAFLRTNRSNTIPEKAPASTEIVSSKPGTNTVARPDRKLLFNSDSHGEFAPTIKRPPPLVPAELCQDPDGQPVSVHDFIEFVCYHGTPCLSPRLAWFSAPRTNRSCPAARGSRSAGAILSPSSKLYRRNSSNGFVSRACIATATPLKRNSETTATLNATNSTGVNGSMFKTEETVPSLTNPHTLTTTVIKSPKVMVAKKMPSVHQVPSFQAPRSDLFDILSQPTPDQIDGVSQPKENNPNKPSSTAKNSSAFRLNKNGETEKSSRRMIKSKNGTKPGRVTRK